MLGARNAAGGPDPTTGELGTCANLVFRRPAIERDSKQSFYTYLRELITQLAPVADISAHR
jgi:hypothetical protein